MPGKIDRNAVVAEIEKYNTLFCDQYDQPYLAVNKSGSVVVPMSGNKFRKWVTKHIRREYGYLPNRNQLDDVIQGLVSIASDEEFNPQISLGLKTVKHDDDTLWYDMGRSAIKITKEGWNEVLEPPIMFRRYPHQIPQEQPDREGNILSLLDFVNISDRGEQLLFLIFTVAAFIPGFPHPILVLHGNAGAGKSTPLRIIKQLIDPSQIDCTPAIKDEAGFVQFASHHALVVFDNLSSVKPEFSDTLARASTGAGFSKRVKYSDDDDFIYWIQRPIAINGINQIVTQSDLLDRSILLELERISPEKRLTERAFWSKLNNQKPQILGGIFNVLFKALQKYPLESVEDPPRMADFAEWGYVIAESIDGFSGEDFVDAYCENINKQNDAALDASPVAQAVMIAVEKHEKWVGEAAEFLEMTTPFETRSKYGGVSRYNTDYEILRKSPLWPNDPEWFVRRLNYVVPNLKAYGIDVNYTRKHNRKIITLSRNENYGNTADTVKNESISVQMSSEETREILQDIEEDMGERYSKSLKRDPYPDV